MLPIVVDPATHERLFDLLAEPIPDAELQVDLAEQGILLPTARRSTSTIDPFAKLMLMAGTDEIGYVLAKERRRSPPGKPTHPPRVDTRIGTVLAG